MPVDRVDRSREVVGRGREAGRLAMDASANYLMNQVRKAFGSDYYKGGAFRSTLQVKQSIRRQGPNWVGNGWESTVGTKLIEALYWELGHYNVFTRKRERVQIWEPAARESVDGIRSTYARVMVRYLGAR